MGQVVGKGIGMLWDGMGYNVMGWDGMQRDGMGWGGMGWEVEMNLRDYLPARMTAAGTCR